MISKEVTIANKLGLHARAAAKLVTCASRYSSSIHLRRNDQEVNGKSIMGVMMLATSQGTKILLVINGKDEAAACQAVEELIAARFGEAE